MRNRPTRRLGKQSVSVGITVERWYHWAALHGVGHTAEQPCVLPHGSLRFDEAEWTKTPGLLRRGVLADALSVENTHARHSGGRAKSGVSSSSGRWDASREVRQIQRRTRAGPGNTSRCSSFNGYGLTAHATQRRRPVRCRAAAANAAALTAAIRISSGACRSQNACESREQGDAAFDWSPSELERLAPAN